MNEVTSSVLDARSVLDGRAAGAYARAEALVPPGPVRPADAVRPRFAVSDGDKAAKAGAAATADTADNPASEPLAAGTPRSGLLGALTNFLARVFAQEGGADAATAPAASGLRAYARAAATPAEPAGVEIASPGFPRLSSGRALDLTV